MFTESLIGQIEKNLSAFKDFITLDKNFEAVKSTTFLYFLPSRFLAICAEAFERSQELVLLEASSVSAGFFPYLQSIPCSGQTINRISIYVKEGRTKKA